MPEEKSLSKADLYFLSLVLSGAVKLESVEVTAGDRGVGIIYLPGREAIARNLMLLDDLRREVARQTEQLSRGQDPLKEIEKSL